MLYVYVSLGGVGSWYLKRKGHKKGNSPFGFIGLGYFVNLTIIIGFKKNVFLSQ